MQLAKFSELLMYRSILERVFCIFEFLPSTGLLFFIYFEIIRFFNFKTSISFTFLIMTKLAIDNEINRKKNPNKLISLGIMRFKLSKISINLGDNDPLETE